VVSGARRYLDMALTEMRAATPDVPSGGDVADSAPTTRGPKFLDAIMDNPLVGLSPWILYSLVEGNNRLELSAAVALGLAVAILFVNWLRGSRPKMLEWSDVVYFAGLTVFVAFASSTVKLLTPALIVAAFPCASVV